MKGTSLIAPPGAFRLILALAVVLNHLTVVQCGRAAVMLFFVLSGYWVSSLWAKTTGPHRVATFYLNRVLRIWPLYFVVMLVCAGLARHVPDLSELFLFGVASRPWPRLIQTEWSLDIELQFYLLLPLLIALRERLATATWIGLMALCVITGSWLETRAGLVTVTKFLPAFAIGIAIQRARWTPTAAFAQASLVAFVLLSVGQVYVSQVQGPLLHHLFGGWDWDAIFAIWVVVLIPYVAASVHQPSNSSDRRLGDLSYPLYLVHKPVLLWLQTFYDWRSPAHVVVLLGAIAAVTAICWAAVDRPAERFRRRLLDRRSSGDAYAVPAT